MPLFVPPFAPVHVHVVGVPTTGNTGFAGFDVPVAQRVELPYHVASDGYAVEAVPQDPLIGAAVHFA